MLGVEKGGGREDLPVGVVQADVEGGHGGEDVAHAGDDVAVDEVAVAGVVLLREALQVDDPDTSYLSSPSPTSPTGQFVEQSFGF